MEGDFSKRIKQQFSLISIHSLRMEGDMMSVLHLELSLYFNPLPPHGGRLGTQTEKNRSETISIHSLRMEGDCP